MYVGTLFLKHKGHTRRHAFTRWRHECHLRHRRMLEATIEDLKRKPEGASERESESESESESEREGERARARALASRLARADESATRRGALPDTTRA